MVFLKKKLIPGCDKKYTVSPGLINLYQTRYNQKFELLRNLPHLKSSPGIPLMTTSKPVILYQGALNIGRGLEETIQAMKFLPNYIFRIVGDGDYTRELQALARKLNLNNQIEFIGPVPFENLANYHQNVMAGICLLHNQGLNYYYSLPNRLFDYLQAGIPVIASEFPDMSDIIKKHQTGLLIRDLNPGTIAQTIRRACEEKSLREKWQETLPKAAREFTWQEEEKKLYAINFGAKSGIDGH